MLILDNNNIKCMQKQCIAAKITGKICCKGLKLVVF